MNYDTIDLNISNYQLPDLLHLFSLQTDFTYQDMKHAYKKVLMTHPDKSKLPKEYFLFFSKAFKIIKSIYDYTHKYEHNHTHTIQESRQYVKTDENMPTMPVNKIKEFHKKFNDAFDKVKIYDDETDNGYDEWLRSHGDTNLSRTIKTKEDMNSYIEEEKKKIKSIIVHNGIEEQSISCGTSIIRNKPTSYCSALFSKLPYDDLKKAHTETVIPVTQDDFYNRKHFSSIDELNQFRSSSTFNTKNGQEIYNQQKHNEHITNIHNAFKLTQQMEQIIDANKKWKANFSFLTNN